MMKTKPNLLPAGIMSGVSEEDLCGGYSNDGVPDSSVVGLVDGADPTATDFLCSQVEATSIQIQMDVTRESKQKFTSCRSCRLLSYLFIYLFLVTNH